MSTVKDSIMQKIVGIFVILIVFIILSAIDSPPKAELTPYSSSVTEKQMQSLIQQLGIHGVNHAIKNNCIKDIITKMNTGRWPKGDHFPEDFCAYSYHHLEL